MSAPPINYLEFQSETLKCAFAFASLLKSDLTNDLKELMQYQTNHLT